jgi:methionyl aminopeptidase
MINIKTLREIELMEKAGKIAYQTHQFIKKYIKPGVTTNELNDLVEQYILSHDATPSFKNYEGFPKAICASVNDEVVHGIPNNHKLQKGDIISIDIGVNYKGYHSDTAWTYSVGEISEKKEYLLKHTKQALYEGIEQVRPGNRVGDIGFAISKYAKKYNLKVIKELVGHGVGNNIHEKPDVPNYGHPGTGPLLKEGMVLAIEPMFNLGTREIYIKDNNWTIATVDGQPSAHFEHTVLITDKGYKILTGE